MGLTTGKASGPNHLIYRKVLSRNRHRVCSPTQRRANKEESKVANRDLVDHQACSLLQYSYNIANIFLMGNYFNKLR